MKTREEIEAALDQEGLVWTKATVDFLPWAETTWLTPSGKAVPTVLGNDHAVVVMGYNDDGVVIRDVLGPTNTNWERAYEYDVPWETFLAVFEAQGRMVSPCSLRMTRRPTHPVRSDRPSRSNRPIPSRSAARSERDATLARIVVSREAGEALAGVAPTCRLLLHSLDCSTTETGIRQTTV